MKHFFIFVLLALLLAACAPAVEQVGKQGRDPADTPAMKSIPTSVPTFTLVPPTVTIAPTPAISATPTALPPFPLDGYVMVFRKNGDLYFQDGNNPPIQLTHGGDEPHSPMISDDNPKIVFFRNKHSEIYSVNADGSQEQRLIANRVLPERLDYQSAQMFVPGTHQLLFNTYKCETQQQKHLCAIGLSIVNTDTGKIKQLVTPDKAGQYNYYGNFKISPNGDIVSIMNSGHIDILDMNGAVIHQDIIPYTPKFLESSHELFPELIWLPDSNTMIVAVPTSTGTGLGAYDNQTYTVWRYMIDSKEAVEIHLDNLYPTYVPTMANQVSISPDGKWILYFHPIRETAEALYLGNLIEENMQFYVKVTSSGVITWSPDSKYFGYGNHWVGSISDLPIQISGVFEKWIDATHFTYLVLDNEVSLKTLIAEIVGTKILTYELPEPYLLINSK